jgi:hypothetical protein
LVNFLLKKFHSTEKKAPSFSKSNFHNII